MIVYLKSACFTWQGGRIVDHLTAVLLLITSFRIFDSLDLNMLRRCSSRESAVVYSECAQH
jgi:hypothetical protein